MDENTEFELWGAALGTVYLLFIIGRVIYVANH